MMPQLLPSSRLVLLLALAACMPIARAQQCSSISTTTWPLCKFYPTTATILYTGGTIEQIFLEINATLNKVAKTPVVTLACEQAAETMLCLNRFRLCTLVGTAQTDVFACPSTCTSHISSCSAAALSLFMGNVNDNSPSTLTTLCDKSSAICQCAARIGTGTAQISSECVAATATAAAVSTLLMAASILAALY